MWEVDGATIAVRMLVLDLRMSCCAILVTLKEASTKVVPEDRIWVAYASQY